MTTGAQAAARTIKAHGLKHVFGIPGVQNLEYFDAFAAEGLNVVLVSHELGASFMADAVGRVSGDPGVVAVVPGPGLTNIFTGLAEALLDSAPLVALIPGVRSNFKETFQLHEIDHEGAAKSLSKLYLKVDDVHHIPAAIAKAIQVSKSGEPGPVVVEVPYNVLMESTHVKPHQPLPLDYPVPSGADIDKVVKMISAAKNPAIHAGFGASGASKQIIELAELLGAPVSTTISGRGVIPEDHELSVGFGFGSAGTELAEKIFKSRDLVIAVGCKFSEVGSGSYGLKMPKLIHIDANPNVLGKNFPADIKIAGDAKYVIETILDSIKKSIIKRDSSKLRDIINISHKKRIDDFFEMPLSSDYVNPARLFFEIRRRAPRDAILTTDSGAHTFFALFSFDAYAPRSILSPIDYSSMGYGVPAAIGASLAAPGHRVIAAVGDGGFLMTGTEMATAKRLGLNLIIVVFNDGELGLIRQAQQAGYVHKVAVELGSLDCKHFASAFGFDYFLIDSDEKIASALDDVFKKERPVLVDARVKYRELTRHTMGSAKSIIMRTPPSVLLRMGARIAWRKLFSS